MLDNLIILHAPALTGGKFIANCLGMSSNSTLLDLEYACLLLEYEKYGDIQNKILNMCQKKYNMIAGTSWPSLTDYIEKNYKLPNNEEIDFSYNLSRIRTLLSFVKPYQCIEELKYDMILSTIKIDNWVGNEFSFFKFWGWYEGVIDTNRLTSDQVNTIEIDEKIKEIHNTGKKFLAPVHSHYTASILNECSKNSIVVKFVNYEKFVKLTSKHKEISTEMPETFRQDCSRISKLYNFKKNNKSHYNEYANFVEFDVDRSMFDKMFMATELNKIYAACNIPMAEHPYYLEKWFNYYIDLHQTMLAHG
jgi:hypothetical protein